jgi:hypothetical protein
MRATTLALVLALVPSAARAFCPCYTLSSASNTNNCGVEAVAGSNPGTAAWQPIFQLVSTGPAAWGNAGPSVPDIGQGCGKPEPQHSVPAVFPCELLRAIAMQESGWRQFCVPDTPADQVGPPERTIISFDCGYGIGQVTSGMHRGETPAFDRARVASDPTYNLATGTLILADKWRATACVGDNQPRVIEDWYVATWAYNGLAFVNNPNNPNYSATRGVCDPAAGCGARPYQERIWGWMEHPPSSQHWAGLAPAYPDRADIPATGATVPDLPEPKCASPTDCTNTRSVHRSACLGDTNINDGAAPPDLGGGMKSSGCGCALGREPQPVGCHLLLIVLALGFALRYKRRA